MAPKIGKKTKGAMAGMMPKSLKAKGPGEKKTTIDLHEQFANLQGYLQKQRENERFWTYIEFTATISLVLVFLVAAIRPTAFTIAKLLGEIRSKEEVSTKMKAKIGDLLEAQSLFVEVQDSYETVASFLPERKNISQVVEQTVGSAQSAGVKVDKVSISKEGKSDKKDEELKGASFQTNTEADWQEFLTWLGYLEKARRYVTVEQVGIYKNKESKVGEAGKTKISVSGRFYWWEKL